MSLPANQVLAAIDIGSNSFHLIVARVVQGSLQTITSHRERVQLALGMQVNMQLDAAAMQRGYQCLQRMGKILRDAQPDQVRVVGTHALRAATNRNDFLAKAETLLGHPIEVITGGEEARLIFQAIAHTQTLQGLTLVIDIGGGSTELASGTGFEPAFSASCGMGCVSFSEYFFSTQLNRQSFERAQTAAFAQIEKYLAQLNTLSWQNIYATSGSAKALAQAAASFGAQADSVSLAQLCQLRDEIVARGSVDWLEEMGIANNRLQLVPGGLAILIACMRCLQLEQLEYRDVALREGVLYEMLEPMRHPDIRQRTRHSLQSLYRVDTAHAERVVSCIDLLQRALPAGWLDSSRAANDILLESAQLHEVGLQISASGLQKHSSYILANSDLPGYNQEQQELLAGLVRLHRKKIRREDLLESRLLPAGMFLRLLVVLRLAVLLNVTRASLDAAQFEQQFRVRAKEGGLKLDIDPGLLRDRALLRNDLDREQGYLAGVGFSLDCTG
ncbi:MAG: exopolyphosphatase [Pseudomonadales bacterium]|nr:exopolyphosphatase [Gammaproteobacteria bacterium]NNL56674.1 exopolyphosphatase [Pseudomonadales bacterium]